MAFMAVIIMMFLLDMTYSTIKLIELSRTKIKPLTLKVRGNICEFIIHRSTFAHSGCGRHAQGASFLVVYSITALPCTDGDSSLKKIARLSIREGYPLSQCWRCARLKRMLAFGSGCLPSPVSPYTLYTTTLFLICQVLFESYNLY